MSGLKKNQGNVSFLQIKRGFITMRVAEKTDTSVEYKIAKGPNEGMIVHEEHFDELEGLVLDIYSSTHDQYGTTWGILVKDEEGAMYTLKFSQKSPYFTGFFTRLENCDLSRPVSFRTWVIKQENGTEKYYGTIMQAGEKIAPKYTKDEPNGMPELKKVFFDGKDQWDSYDRDQFLIEIVSRLQPELSQNTAQARFASLNSAQAEPNQAKETQDAEQEHYQESDEDIPF